jgi:hypothetical protein
MPNDNCVLCGKSRSFHLTIANNCRYVAPGATAKVSACQAKDEKHQTLYGDLSHQFDLATDRMIHEEFPQLSSEQKHHLLTACADDYQKAAAKIVEKLYAQYCYLEAVRTT